MLIPAVKAFILLLRRDDRRTNSKDDENWNNGNSSFCYTKSFIKAEDGCDMTDNFPNSTCIRNLSGSGTLCKNGRSRRLSLDKLKRERGVSIGEGFLFDVSLQNGYILYTSEDISNHLGYPKDMVVGKSIMNFLLQKDHITFTNHLSQGLNAYFIQGKRDNSHLVLNPFFCRLRIYQGVQLGYSVSQQKNKYKPFKITLHMNELTVDNMCVGTLGVKATAIHVSSAYSVPEEISAMSFFSTRHTASCHFSHVDASAIPYLGYLPQDMIVIKKQGSTFRSKPYRFKVQNGSFILLETEWSCFIDPWSHKLEFVVGQHRALKGPTDIDIFAIPKIEHDPQPEKNIKESQLIQKEITTFLSQSSDRVVIGDISPYKEVNDSSWSSETPPTVQQLRYQENIERFFASQPKTYSDGSEEYSKIEKLSNVEDSQGIGCGSGKGSGVGIL